MKKTFIIALLAIALTGCGAFGGSKEESLAVSPTLASTPTTIETLTTVPAAPSTTIEARYIDIGPVLDKLSDMGCIVEKLELREVSRGGHVSINCLQQIDPLNAKTGNL